MGVAQAADRVTITFTPQSSVEWVKLLHPELATSAEASGAICAAEVLRPDYGADAMSDPANRIRCQVGSTEVQDSLAEDQIEAWGTHFEKFHFQMKGKAATAIWAKFKLKTAHLSMKDSDTGIWSRMVVCDPNGDLCLTAYSLNDEASEDAGGQVICNRQTQLKRGVDLKQAHQADVTSDNPAEEYENMIDTQLAQGLREAADPVCIVLK